MPPVILTFSELDSQRARDGVNFAPFPLLSIANGAFVNAAAGASCFPLTFGAGVSLAVPGTHLYWSTNGGVIKRCDGANITTIAAGPTRDQNYQLLYDQPNDRMYVAYFGPAGANFRVAWFDFQGTWDTSITNTLALATGSGCIRLIPEGAINAGLLLAGWCNDSRAPGTRCAVQRWDPVGVAWVDEMFTSSASNTPKTMIAQDDKIIFCTTVALNNAAHPLVYQRDGFGAWSDITPADWNIAFQRRAAAAAVYNGELYVAFHRITAGTKSEIWKRDAFGLWTLSLDLIAEGTGLTTRPVSLAVIDGQLYCGLADDQVGYFLLKPSALGAWERRPVAESQQFPGFPGDASFFVESAEGTITPNTGNCSSQHGPTVVVTGYWDNEVFDPWVLGPAAWTNTAGVWGLSTPPTHVGTEVYIGLVDATWSLPNGNGSYAGVVDVVDDFVLTARTPNGRGVVNVSLHTSATGNHPLFLADAFEFICPNIDSIDPVSASLNGGVTVTLRGTNFFSNQITPSNPVNWARVVNRIFVRNGAGTVANPYRIVEVRYQDIVVVDEETITFPLPPFPGGADPVVEVILSPAGLAPFNFGAPVGIAPSYKCPRDTIAFTYTGVEFAILGSLETLLGLGGTGGDVIFPASGGAAASPDPRCPTDMTPGPCIR